MRGWVVARGSPESVRLADDLPEAEPARDEVVVEVKATSVNRGELELVATRPDGFRPGQDVAGVVVRAAADGEGPALGARVVGLVDWKGWAERVAIARAHVAPLPEAVSFATAATLPVAGLTALRALRSGGGDLLGRRVLVTGPTGGVGQIAVQLARAAGARVTALVRRGSEEAARALGADQAIASLEGEARAFDLVLEGLGGPTVVAALRRLAPGGTLAMYGALGGKAAIDVFDFADCPGARLVGMFLDRPGDRAGEELGTLVALVAEGRLRPVVGLTLDWTRAPDALAALRGGAVRGKAVLTRA